MLVRKCVLSLVVWLALISSSIAQHVGWSLYENQPPAPTPSAICDNGVITGINWNCGYAWFSDPQYPFTQDSQGRVSLQQLVLEEIVYQDPQTGLPVIGIIENWKTLETSPTKINWSGTLSSDVTIDAAMIDLQKGLRNGVEVLYDNDVWTEARKRVGELVAASMGGGESKVEPTSSGDKKVTLKPVGNPNEDKIKQTAEVNAAYKAGRVEMEKATKTLKDYGATWSDVVVNSTTNWPKIFSKSVDKVEIYQDALKQNWVEVNGKLTNTWGETGEIIQTEHGQMIKYMNAGQVKYEEVSVKTYTTAKQVFEEMISQGIKPGTEAAKAYEEKINALGGAVAVINGKSIFIPIKLDDWSFWTSIDSVNKYLNTLALKNRIIASVGLSGAGITVKDTPDGGYTTQYAGGPAVYYAPGATDVNQGQRLATGGMFDAKSKSMKKFAYGGLVKKQKDGILANIGEGGYDEFVISTDPKYRAQSIGYLSAAAGKLGVGMASRAAAKAASSSASISYGGSKTSEYAGGGSGDVYISLDTFIGEEEWFASMAGKYNMKTVPRQRKLEGQQKRVVSSYNDRYRLR